LTKKKDCHKISEIIEQQKSLEMEEYLSGAAQRRDGW